MSDFSASTFDVRNLGAFSTCLRTIIMYVHALSGPARAFWGHRSDRASKMRAYQKSSRARETISGPLSLLHALTMMMKRKRGPRKKSKVAQIGASLLLSAAAFQLLTSEGGESNDAAAHSGSTATLFLRRKLSIPNLSEEAEERRPRPRMYTFYHRVPTTAKESTDQETLDVWKEEWTRAGFDARVLTLDDATAHPNFNSYK